MRGQWFIDGTWLPLEEDESDLIELEHLARFRGHQMREIYETATEVVTTTVDSKDCKVDGLNGKWDGGVPCGASGVTVLMKGVLCHILCE
jgi:hypothetical protein